MTSNEESEDRMSEYIYFQNKNTYPLSLPKRPVGGQVPVPIGHFVEGPYYMSLARGDNALLTLVADADVPREARVETLDEEPRPGERRLLVWSQNRYMERQKGVFEPVPASLSVITAPLSSQPVTELAPESEDTTTPPPAVVEPPKTEGGTSTNEDDEGADDHHEAKNDSNKVVVPVWSKTKLRSLNIADVRGVATQIAQERGMSVPEGNPSKEQLIEFIVAATAE